LCIVRFRLCLAKFHSRRKATYFPARLFTRYASYSLEWTRHSQFVTRSWWVAGQLATSQLKGTAALQLFNSTRYQRVSYTDNQSINRFYYRVMKNWQIVSLVLHAYRTKVLEKTKTKPLSSSECVKAVRRVRQDLQREGFVEKVSLECGVESS